MTHPEDHLSEHLTVGEFLTTQQRDYVAEQWRLWLGTPALQDAGRYFARSTYEQARVAIGVPLHINSGYRCPPLNTLVGGVPTSRHMLAQAVDVVPVGLSLEDAMKRLAAAVSAGTVPDLDKAILECGAWIHIQGSPIGSTPKRLCLKTNDRQHFTQYA